MKDHELARDLDVAGSTNPNLRPSNVQVYEDVLIANGSPMHVSRILDAALLRGVELKGDRSEVDQVRNALARSNRFHNVGANTWWIGQSPVREEATPSAAAVSSAETPCLEGAGDAAGQPVVRVFRRGGWVIGVPGLFPGVVYLRRIRDQSRPVTPNHARWELRQFMLEAMTYHRYNQNWSSAFKIGPFPGFSRVFPGMALQRHPG